MDAWTRPPLTLLVFVLACGPAPAGELRDGDVVFQTSSSAQSQAIQRATDSPYSHLGIVSPWVLEAVATVRYTPFAEWAARGEGGSYAVRRLRDAGEVLTAEKVAALRRTAEAHLGRPYDLWFEWSDERIYCSELVWKAYRDALGIELGETERLGDLDLDDPVVAAKLRERFGERLPLDEPVISPAAMYASERLVAVR
jgi:cell wall-associated NlpC family hydrolase